MSISEKPDSIKQFIDYCSNCIICGKKLNIYFSYNSFYDYSFTNRNRVTIKDNCLIDSKKNIILNIETNQVDNSFINNNFKKVSQGSFQQYVDILKSCKTCIYENNCSFILQSNNLKIDNITLGIERVSFFIKKNKQIEIINYYENNDLISKIYQLRSNSSDLEYANFLKVKNLLDFSEINNFSQLKKKILSIITFY